MSMPAGIFRGVFGLVVVTANVAYWWFVARPGNERFRSFCERRYGVTITSGYRGYWSVTGEGPWLRRVGVEWLQLAYFLAAFFVWAAAMGLLIAAISWAARSLRL